MFESRLGELAALGTALFWTVRSLSFESASRKVGSLPVNLLRLLMAFAMLSFFCFLHRGVAFPVDAEPHMWFWLSLSGLFGFVLGDLCLFKAFVIIGSRISTLIMALVPPITASIGWLMLGERLLSVDLVGMALTVGGVMLVILQRQEEDQRIALSKPLNGILCGLGGAFGQAIGLVLSKHGMRDYDPFAASQIRQITGILGFCALFFLLRAWPRLGAALRNRKALAATSLGALAGPFLAVSLSLVSIQYIATGKAATIMATTPIFIIPPAVILFNEQVTVKEIIGALIAVSGVALLFL